MTTALTDALHARYFRGEHRPRRRNSPAAGDGARLRAAARPTPCSPTSSAATAGGSATGRRPACRRSSRTAPSLGGRLRAASSTCSRAPPRRVRPRASRRSTATAGLPRPSWPAIRRVPTTRTPPSSPSGRDDARPVARVAQRLRERAPFALAPAVPAFTRRIAPASRSPTSPAPAPRSGATAAALAAAGAGRGRPRRRPRTARRAAALDLAHRRAGLDPAAPHLNPGNPEFPPSELLGQHLLGDLHGPGPVGRHQADPGAPVEQVGDRPRALVPDGEPQLPHRLQPPGDHRVRSPAPRPPAPPCRSGPTSRDGASTRASAGRGAAPTSGSRPVSERGGPAAERGRPRRPPSPRPSPGRSSACRRPRSGPVRPTAAGACGRGPRSRRPGPVPAEAGSTSGRSPA